MAMLAEYPGRAAFDTIRHAASDGDSIVRRAALRALTPYPPEARWLAAAGLLKDPVRAVRIETARALAVAPVSIPAAQRDALQRGLQEYIAARRAVSERPSSHVDLGDLFGDLGRFEEAEDAYRTAMRIDPHGVPPYVNLADLHRRRGDDAACERLLRDAMQVDPTAAATHHALGLTLVRLQRRKEAMTALRVAAETAPDVPRFAFVYAVALADGGQVDEALATLGRAHRRHPYDLEVLLALVTMHRDRGAFAEALAHARHLTALDPEDRAARALLQELERAVSDAPR